MFNLYISKPRWTSQRSVFVRKCCMALMSLSHQWNSHHEPSFNVLCICHWINFRTPSFSWEKRLDLENKWVHLILGGIVYFSVQSHLSFTNIIDAFYKSHHVSDCRSKGQFNFSAAPFYARPIGRYRVKWSSIPKSSSGRDSMGVKRHTKKTNQGTRCA